MIRSQVYMALIDKLPEIKTVQKIMDLSRRISVPGFDGLSVYEVGRFFIIGLRNGAITTRGSGIAFRIFLSIFPAVLFLITLIPYIPIENFQETLLALLTGALPVEVADLVEDTFRDLLVSQRAGLLSATFVLSLYAATRSMLGIIRSFDASYHDFATHPRPVQWLVSIGLVGLLFGLIIIASVLQIAGSTIISFVGTLGIIGDGPLVVAINIGRIALAAALVLTGVSAIYYWAPAAGARSKFASPGSLLATVAIAVVNGGFNFYVENLSNWNAIYGTIGTIVMLLLWLYGVSMVLLIGFELNVSISEAGSNGSPSDTFRAREQEIDDGIASHHRHER
ncbi:MAG: YihY/virulence factor BrkB family protein [Spirochaetaceae bacterium]|nr:MAG: YihY/virulence factor BrkB family protein [Spirochaetaceae bacterium]